MTTIAEFRIPEIVTLMAISSLIPLTSATSMGAELTNMIDIHGSDAASLSSAPSSAASSSVYLPLGNVDANTGGGHDNVSYLFESGVNTCA